MSEFQRKVALRVTVNGVCHETEVDARMLLVDFLRSSLGLTGTHVGCDTSSCGACTVLVGGRSAKSCTLLAAQVHDAEITTVEGLQNGERLHPLQAAFREHHALQCGFCTPGMLASASDLLRHNTAPTEAEIRRAIAGNICRCTGYHNIVRAIAAAADEMKNGAGKNER